MCMSVCIIYDIYVYAELKIKNCVHIVSHRSPQIACCRCGGREKGKRINLNKLK